MLPEDAAVHQIGRTHLRHLPQQHDGQAQLEDQGVCRFAESFRQKACLSQQKTQHHDGKDRQGGVDAEQKIVEHEILHFREHFRENPV